MAVTGLTADDRRLVRYALRHLAANVDGDVLDDLELSPVDADASPEPAAGQLETRLTALADLVLPPPDDRRGVEPDGRSTAGDVRPNP